MEIPKMKVLVYALTFLGYAWSGYGSSILTNLKDAVLSAEHVFGDVFKKAITVFRKVTEVHSALTDAIEEECIYTCEDGSKPQKNKYHKPTSNGCGVPGMSLTREQLGSLTDMTKCCDEHDICYGTCNKVKEMCDYDFKKCLYKVCAAVQDKVADSITQGCKSTAKLLYTATVTLGCKFYKLAQEEACYCPPHTRRNEF